MTYQSIPEVFQLTPDILAARFGALPYYPLAHVVADNNHPKLVLGFDYVEAERVLRGVVRSKSMCTHINVTVIPDIGQPPVCRAFGAKCLVETFKDGKIQKLNPHLQDEDDAIFGALKGLSNMQKLRHSSLWTCMDGQVVDESWRLCDGYISIDLHSDRQIAGALAVIEEWTRSPPSYKVLSSKGKNCKGKNCKDFVDRDMDGAGIRKPFFWDARPWPFLYARGMENVCKGHLRRVGEWLLQPGAVTRQMYEADCQRGACFSGRSSVPPVCLLQ